LKKILIGCIISPMRMGRPPKPKSQRRTEFVKVMLTVAEKRAALKAAGGKNLSVWVRMVLVSAVGK